MISKENINLSIDLLLSEENGTKVKNAISVLEKIQENLCALAENEEERTLTEIKTGTIILLSVLKKMAGGITPNHFSEKDYADIAEAVSKYAVQMDGQDYSIFVFDLYAGYIEASIKVLAIRVDEKRLNTIQALADELRIKAIQLKNNEITETAYTQDCLWISLEAMMKLLATYAGALAGKDYIDLTQAISAYAFEYGRLMLLEREQVLLSEYIEKQYQLDQELEERFEAFKAELQAESDRYRSLVERAFEPAFRDSLKNSIELAKMAGVKEEEILDSVEDIDSFFMD